VRNHVAAVRELANESQRDSVTQPSVAKLPWVKVKKPVNPKGVASHFKCIGCPRGSVSNPNGIPSQNLGSEKNPKGIFVSQPRVARARKTLGKFLRLGTHGTGESCGVQRKDAGAGLEISFGD